MALQTGLAADADAAAALDPFAAEHRLAALRDARMQAETRLAELLVWQCPLLQAPPPTPVDDAPPGLPSR